MTLEVLIDVDSVARRGAELIAGVAKLPGQKGADMRVGIATDHGGFGLTEELITLVEAVGGTGPTRRGDLRKRCVCAAPSAGRG